MSDLTARMAECLRMCREHIGQPRWAFNESAVRDRIDALLTEAEQRGEAKPVAYAALTRDGKSIARFDGRMMVSDARNEHHPVPLYAAPQPAVPEGCVLVPREPTREMHRAALDSDGTVFGTYAAMLAAAPTPRGGGWRQGIT